MATRRPNPTQRTRTISLNTATRPRPFPTSDTAFPEPAPLSAALASGSLASTRVGTTHSSSSLDSESQIKVYVRCRGPSTREKAEGPLVVKVDGRRSQEVVIQTAAPTSVLGVTTPAATRTYPFDGAFGFAADQRMIYDEVVSPMLTEVLEGYNCTLFAYGQTGTGKTHTMQGDLTPSEISGGLSVDAGMIPRVISNLFAHLEANVPDYTVKITYVELYNEKIRDLLNPSLGVPLGSEQPMSKGTQARAANLEGGDGDMKIRDDPRRGGMCIEGLEERYVTNAKEAIKQLREGSDRRQTAATKLNIQSSRSHSVFTVTVHTKIKATGSGMSGNGGVAGEDYIRTGKLNLVDLAGSENIGRSGAENAHAREAGNINMSLLTLGRVINALVAKDSRIPYRDSKLTHLLQDSLGGRTKTCIVATISPAESNLKETFSTLDYALRAKSIKNKPEVNQQITRNSLLKEYVTLIETLKNDLRATREKNGVYWSNESWEAILAEQKDVEQARLNAKQECDQLEAQLSKTREQFTELLALFEERNTKLTDTKIALDATTAQLTSTQALLVEETKLKEAHRAGEERLDRRAKGLKSVAQQLSSKVERKEDVREANAQAVVDGTGKIGFELTAVGSEVDELVGVQERAGDAASRGLEQLREKTLQSLAVMSAQIDTSSQSLGQYAKLFGENDKEASLAIDNAEEVVNQKTKEIHTGYNLRVPKLKKQYAETLQERHRTVADACHTAETARGALDGITKASDDALLAGLKGEKELINKAESVGLEYIKAENQRLKAENTLLRQMLDADNKRALELESALTSKVTSLIKEYSSTRSQALQDSAQNLQAALTTSLKENETFSKTHPRTFDGLRIHGDKMAQAVTEHAGRRRIAEQQASKAIWAIDENVKTVMSEMTHEFGHVMDGQGREIKSHIENSSKDVSAGFAEVRRAKRARTELENKLCPEIQESYRALGSSGAAVSRSTGQAISKRLEAETSRLQATQSIQTQIQGRLSTLRQANRTIMTNGTRPDVPTGSTPQKRAWEDDDAYEHTGGRGSDWAFRQMLQEQQKRDQLQRQLEQSTSIKELAVEERLEPVATTSAEVRDDVSDEAEDDVVEEGPSGEHTGPIVLETAPGAPPPYTREEMPTAEKPSISVAAPTIRPMRQTTKTASQSTSQAIAQGRPPSKVGGIARKASGKAPLVEKNATARSKRVK